jgi:hypothetical protein
MIAANNASSSSYEVRISPLIDESTALTSRHTSMPLPAGSRPSNTATPGRNAGIRRVVFCAEPDSPTTSISSLACKVNQAAADHLVVVEQEHANHPSGSHHTQRAADLQQPISLPSAARCERLVTCVLALSSALLVSQPPHHSAPAISSV